VKLENQAKVSLKLLNGPNSQRPWVSVVTGRREWEQAPGTADLDAVAHVNQRS
jgi:hypothetical protein